MEKFLVLCLLISCGRPIVAIAPEPRKVGEAIENDPRGSLTIGVEFLQIVERFETIWGKG